MESSHPKYSIIIPTRNGGRYLPYAIGSVLAQPSKNFELIVSDNHSSDGTAEYLDQLNDPRLIKTKPPEELPMTMHFEYAVSLARGEWVAVIGDDDGLLPFFFEFLDSIDLDAIAAPAIVFRRAFYFWDGTAPSGVVVSYKPSKQKRYIKNRGALLLALSSISVYFDMPQLYTCGLVRNSFVKQIREQLGGRCFYATSPDAASAATLAIRASYHYRVEQPIFWTGTSRKSVGYSSKAKEDKSRADEFHRLNTNVGLTNARVIPESIHELLSMAAVLYDALLLDPGLQSFWKSRAIRNLFAAGLILSRPEKRGEILAAYGGEASTIAVGVLVPVLRVLKWLYQRKRALLGAFGSRPSLVSKDAERFRDMELASGAVAKLYKASK
jgi:glycosyltransferase involved in cell wall biosynthesis